MKSPLTHLFIALVLVLVLGAGYILWYAEVSKKSSAVAQLESQIVAANDNVGRIASANAALAEISGDEAKVKGYFVSESGVVPLITDLESLGAAQKAVIKVLSVSTAGSAAQSALVLDLSIRGTFDAVMRAMGAVEFAPYDVTLTRFSVQQDVTKDAWHADLTLSVGSSPIVSATSTSSL
jgi:hypothetical protein